LVTSADLANSIPLVIVAASSLIILIIEAIFPKINKQRGESIIFYFSLFALICALSFSFRDVHKDVRIYNDFIKINTMTVILNITLIFGMFMTILSSKDYLEKENINYGEYYSLVFLSLLGMMLLVSANDLVILFIGLELMSVCFYVLAGFMRKRLESNESGLKYFLLGAFFTGFLLLGIAFIYGFTGNTNYSVIAGLGLPKESFYTLGLILVFIGFVFKTGSFPLQMWIPDVYQGSPTIVAGMMSSVGKTAAFGALISFFTVFAVKDVPVLIAAISILTMLYGNVVALMQSDIKRLLAYSSIAHAGYIMIGFIEISFASEQAVLFYLIAYIFMQLGAFIAVGIVESKGSVSSSGSSSGNNIEGYKGLGKTNPGLASILTIFLLSLAGIPPLAGFWGKYYIFFSIIQANYFWVAIVGILLSLIGVYYYIRIILFMWFYEPAAGTIEKAKKDFAYTAAVLSALGLFVFGLYPELVLKLIRTITQ
jgi:NADH-quinone oxidoreductase subunit N